MKRSRNKIYFDIIHFPFHHHRRLQLLDNEFHRHISVDLVALKNNEPLNKKFMNSNIKNRLDTIDTMIIDILTN